MNINLVHNYMDLCSNQSLICFSHSLYLQIFEESSKLQNIRLERQQALQKKHLQELKEFAEAYSNDKLPHPSLSRERQNSERGSLTSEQSHSNSQTSIGRVSL